MTSAPGMTQRRANACNSDLSQSHDPLNESNLRRHNETAQSDDVFEDSLVRQERAQVFERSAHAQCQDNDIEPGQFGAQNVQSVTKLYGSTAYSLFTMKRYIRLDPVNEPQPWDANGVMRERGLRAGSMESFQLRTDAVDLIAHGALLAADREDSSDTSVQPMYRRAGDVPRSDIARVIRGPKQVMRPSSGGEHKRRRME